MKPFAVVLNAAHLLHRKLPQDPRLAEVMLWAAGVRAVLQVDHQPVDHIEQPVSSQAVRFVVLVEFGQPVHPLRTGRTASLGWKSAPGDMPQEVGLVGEGMSLVDDSEKVDARESEQLGECL
jgi:hypothetical protein